MQRILRPTAVLAALFMAGAMTIVPASSESPSPAPDPSPSLAAETPSPTPSIETPSPTPERKSTPAPSAWSPPPGYTGSLQPNMTVQISGTDSCLNARIQPGLTVAGEGGPLPVQVFNCLLDGFTGKLTATEWTPGTPPPVLADNHWWWYLLGQGWVAEDWLVAAAPSQSAAATGLIAFTRTDGVWLMKADGTGQHRIHAVDLTTTSIDTLRWSPDGSMLVAGIQSWNATLTQVSRVLSLDGTVVAEYPWLSYPAWSPDGRSLAGLRAEPVGAYGGYWFAPVVVDRASGAETVVGPYSNGVGDGPVWSPDSQSVAFMCISSNWEEQAPDGTIQTHTTACEGGDGLRVMPASGGSPRVILQVTASINAYYSRPSWSPTGNVIALLALGPAAGCSGYALVNANNGAITECFAIPDNGSLNFGCGGGPAVGPSDWSGDGRLLAYHSQSGWGDNGIVIVDVQTGAETSVPSLYAYTVDFGPDDLHIVFGADDQVWTAGVDGSGPVHLAQGNMPAWQPVP